MIKAKKDKMNELGKVRNKKIKFIKKEFITDDNGFETNSNIVIRECYTSIRGLRGKEFYEASSIQAQEDKVFNCNYFEGLNNDMYIEYQGIEYNIKSINNLYEENKEYEIHASITKPSS